MAHYAKVNNNIVEQVIVAGAAFFDTFVDSSPGEWIQTFYNADNDDLTIRQTLKYNYAGIGYSYDKEANAFIAPEPVTDSTYILNTSTYIWEEVE